MKLTMQTPNADLLFERIKTHRQNLTQLRQERDSLAAAWASAEAAAIGDPASLSDKDRQTFATKTTTLEARLRGAELADAGMVADLKNEVQREYGAWGEERAALVEARAKFISKHLPADFEQLAVALGTVRRRYSVEFARGDTEIRLPRRREDNLSLFRGLGERVAALAPSPEPAAPAGTEARVAELHFKIMADPGRKLERLLADLK